MKHIPFNRPPVTGKEIEYLESLLKEGSHLSGDGPYTKFCHKWFEEKYDVPKALLTTSCTHSLEMAAILADIGPGDEVIMPSFTFVSTANAFVLRGAKIVFVDIRPDTMNIDETLIEEAITPKTRAIVPVHYAGISCEMAKIRSLAEEYNLVVIEDAAQAILSKYNGQYLGTFGHFGCLSFHETKNISCGEGGALLINDQKYIERAEIIREKGTNRSRFFRGQVDKYGWVDVGSSYLPSELNSAVLKAQLEMSMYITNIRRNIWNHYYSKLIHLKNDDLIDLPTIPNNCENNAHIFYIKAKDLVERTALLEHLRRLGIGAVFHYIPLHNSLAGKRFGEMKGDDNFTTRESERLIRLPLFFNAEKQDIDFVIDGIINFYRKM